MGSEMCIRDSHYIGTSFPIFQYFRVGPRVTTMEAHGGDSARAPSNHRGRATLGIGARDPEGPVPGNKVH